MDSKFGVRNAREPSRARMKILRTTEQSEGNVMDVQGFVISLTSRRGQSAAGIDAGGH